MAAKNQCTASAILFALVGCLASSHSFASETAAVNVSGFYALGAVNGFVGFSFTPTVSIAVNNVSYLQAGSNATPTITFWSGANVLATYVLPPGFASVQWISYTNAPLILNAGNTYSITLQNGSQPLLFYESYPQGAAPNGQFLPSAQITNYNGLATGASSTNFFPDLNFEYLLVPQLNVVHQGSNVIISWPASATSFSLQRTLILSPANWINVTNLINTTNNFNSVTLPATNGTAFFHLVSPGTFPGG
jgi:hypothetical protein